MNDRPTILLIGTDRYVLDACVRHDLDVLLVRGFHSYDNGQIDVPGRVTTLLVEDQRNPETVLSALHRAGLAGRRVDAIQTTNEQSLVTAGVLGRALGCRAIDPAVAVHFRDKYLQKQVVRAAGVPTARSTYVPDVRELEQADELPYPSAVLKPVAGAATALTSVVDDVATLRATARSVRARSAGTRQFVLEERVAGDEWVADGVMADGRLVFLSLGAYRSPCLETVTGRRPLQMYRFDPADDAWAYRLAQPVVTRSLEALGLVDGVFHLELFHQGDEGRLLFGECAARRGGGLIFEEVLCKFGVDLADAAVRAALGWQARIDPKMRPGGVGTTYLTAPPGLLISCPHRGELSARPEVEFARLDVAVGATVSDAPQDTNGRAGAALVTADSTAQLLDRMDALVGWFRDRCVVAPVGASSRELRDWQQRTWPEIDFSEGNYQPG